MNFTDFKLVVTNADGSTSVMTLAAAGISEIDLTGDATHIELPDGSVITGQTTFTRSDGSTGTVGDVTLMADGQSYRVVQSMGRSFDIKPAFIAEVHLIMLFWAVLEYRGLAVSFQCSIREGGS